MYKQLRAVPCFLVLKHILQLTLVLDLLAVADAALLSVADARFR